MSEADPIGVDGRVEPADLMGHEAKSRDRRPMLEVQSTADETERIGINVSMPHVPVGTAVRTVRQPEAIGCLADG